MNNPRITESEIEMIREAKAGSKSAFTHIFETYKDFVDNLLFGYLKDKDEAKELTNLVFLKVYEKLSKFTDYSSFGGWLRILAKNTAIDYLRTIKGYNKSLDCTEHQTQLQVSDGSDEMTAINRVTYNQVVELIEKMSPLYRDSIYMYYVDNLSVAEISEALNIPEGTIKSNLFRGRQQLKKLLKTN
jgi:RNA polymerase sigma-70 factor (ECF subfamily)